MAHKQQPLSPGKEDDQVTLRDIAISKSPGPIPYPTARARKREQGTIARLYIQPLAMSSPKNNSGVFNHPDHTQALAGHRHALDAAAGRSRDEKSYTRGPS